MTLPKPRLNVREQPAHLVSVYTASLSAHSTVAFLSPWLDPTFVGADEYREPLESFVAMCRALHQTSAMADLRLPSLGLVKLQFLANTTHWVALGRVLTDPVSKSTNRILRKTLAVFGRASLVDVPPTLGVEPVPVPPTLGVVSVSVSVPSVPSVAPVVEAGPDEDPTGVVFF